MMSRAKDEENLSLQLWKFEGGLLVNWNGLSLDIVSWGNEAKVVLYNKHGDFNQQLSFTDNEIVNLGHGTLRVLEVSDGNLKEGIKV